MIKSLVKKYLGTRGYRIAKIGDDFLTEEGLSVVTAIGRTLLPGLAEIEGANRYASMVWLKRLSVQDGVDLIFDVGAYKGYFGEALRRLGFRGRIISIEPNPEVLPALRERARKDTLWSVVEAAVGQERGVAVLETFADPSFASTRPPNARAFERFGPLIRKRARYTVEVYCLDDIVSKLDLSDSLASSAIKADTQGNDLEVLWGAKSIVGKARWIQVEAAFDPLYAASPSFQNFHDFLVPQGYKLTNCCGISHDREKNSILEADVTFSLGR